MKRQNFKTPLVVSGIFICTLLAAMTLLFFQFTAQDAALMNWLRSRSPAGIPAINQVGVPPMAGHWLRTDREKWYAPPLQETKKAGPANLDAAPPAITLQAARSSLNKALDSVNIMYIWADGDRLRVISITSFNRKTKQAAVVVIPLSTVINSGSAVNPDGKYMTVQDLYREQGRDGVHKFLEEKLEIGISNFAQVNHSALQKLSDIVGVLQVNGDDITMLEAFEQTERGARTDDHNVVRAVADQILHPRMLLEVPKLVWIFTHDIRTNFSTQQMITMFHFSREMDLHRMRKAALPGIEYPSGSGKDVRYLFVSDQTWKNVVYEITN